MAFFHSNRDSYGDKYSPHCSTYDISNLGKCYTWNKFIFIPYCLLMYISYHFIFSCRSFSRDLVKTFSRGKVTDVAVLMKLRRQYQYLVDLILLTDDVFSSAVFCWYSSFILSVCIDITFDVALFKDIRTFAFFISILKLSVLIALYGIICISASLAGEEIQKCLPLLYKLTTINRSVWSNVHLAQTFQVFSSHMKASQVALTGWKCFTLNRTFIITVVGIFVSYVIIIIQLNPMVMTNIIQGDEG